MYFSLKLENELLKTFSLYLNQEDIHSHLFDSLFLNSIHSKKTLDDNRIQNFQKYQNSLLTAQDMFGGSTRTTLAMDSFKNLFTKEPGSTYLGEKIRTMILKKEFDMCSLSEFLLFSQCLS